MIKNIKRRISSILKVIHLSPGFFNKIIFFCTYIWLSVRHRIKDDWKKALKINLRFNGVDFVFYSQYATDLSVLDEVFVKKDYDYEFKLAPRVIFDLGSNTGLSTIFFRIKYPESTIYSFEPDPKVFDWLCKNINLLNNVKAFNVAVSDVDDYVDFFYHPKSNIVSSLERRFNEQIKIKVKSKKIESIIKELGIDSPDIIKFDVEGAENKAFSVFDTSNVSGMVGELHTDLAKTNLNDFLNLFSHHKSVSKQIAKDRYLIYLSK